MNLNALRDRLDKAEDEVKRRQGVELDAPGDSDKHRMLAVAALSSSACVAVACGHDVKEAAARCAGRLRAFPEDEWPSLFDQARASLRRGTSDRELPAASVALAALIEAVQASA